jgi:hypothetical protein
MVPNICQIAPDFFINAVGPKYLNLVKILNEFLPIIYYELFLNSS